MRLVAGLALLAAFVAVAVFAFLHLPRSAPAPQAATPAAACAHGAAHDVTLAGTAYKVEGASTGASCAGAALSLTVRDGAGAELWRYSAPYLDLALGGKGAEAPPEVSGAEMEAFLKSWVDLTVSHAATLPDWPEGAAHLSLVEGALLTDTPLERSAYEALRKADAPTLCYAAAMDVSHCIIIEAATHKGKLLAAFGAHEADLRMAP